MENFIQIENDILNKLKNVKDRNSLDLVKTEIFGKKGILTELFKKIGSLEQNQKKKYASKVNDLKIKVSEVIEKKELSLSFLKKLEVWIKAKEKNMLQNLMLLKQK